MRNHSPLRQQNFPAPLKEQLGDNAGLLITLSDITLLLLFCLVIWHVLDKRDALQRVTSTSEQMPATVAALPESENSTTTDVSFIPPIVTVRQEQNLEVSPQAAEAGSRWSLLKSELQAEVLSDDLNQSVGLISTEHELFVTLKETLLFDSGRADLNTDSEATLARVAAFAQKHADLALEVLGHTDEVPIATAEFPSNWELSAARASRVARYLVTAGVPPSRISAQGYASFRPRVPNDSSQHRMANRRVELRFYQRVDTAGEPPS
jgi:chemotaxis protein MotB